MSTGSPGGLAEPAGPAASRVERVLVVVPARDEERLVGGCLRSVLTAVEQLHRGRPGCLATVVVVMDGCRDATAAVVARVPGVVGVTVALGVVGSVRAAGVAAGLSLVDVAASGGPGSVWLAHTDADSRVPACWLEIQVELAEAGADLVLGTVEPDPDDTDPRVADGWWTGHRLGEDHQAVHGANLGVRASAYADVGGFAPLARAEDVDLVARLLARDAAVVRTDRTRVRSSGRTQGRLRGGFADYLAGLA